MTQPLSPTAQAVLDAYFTHADLLNREVTHEEMLAAALRAAAEKIEDLYCESDVDSSDGVVFALRQLVLIADELKSK